VAWAGRLAETGSHANLHNGVKRYSPGRVANSIGLSRYADRIVLVILLLGITASFAYGWYFDSSVPRSGRGWADQGLYATVAERLASGQLPQAGHMHYQLGYPLLGAAASQIIPSDPFMPVSFALLSASAALIFLAARRLLSIWAAVMFMALLFYWDGEGRTFNYATELFIVPWNNQVLMFAFAFFFWILSRPPETTVSLSALAVTGLVTGLTVATREEAAIFVLPLAVAVLAVNRASPRQWILLFAIALVAFAPHALIKTLVLGSPLASGRASASYGDLAAGYLSAERLVDNLREVVYDSSLSGIPDIDRKALLQASPWLWLSPVGVAAYLFGHRSRLSTKFYIIFSLALLGFYLAGENMSGQKLQFHCLRYIAPSFIALNFTVAYVVDSLSRTIGASVERVRGSLGLRLDPVDDVEAPHEAGLPRKPPNTWRPDRPSEP
jgi:hypothetical protein